jgi:hypothetical protein
MGTLRSLSAEPTGYVYNGVILGNPVELDDDPHTFEWDDGAFPYGTANVIDGELVVVPDPETAE